MWLTTRCFAAFVLIVSAVVLGAALASQHWGGLMPCELCIVQRWPWTAAIVIALIGLLVGDGRSLSWLALALAVVFAVGVAFAFYHVGVEQRWFAGPSACTVGGGQATTLEEMKRQIAGTQPVLCDQVQWSLFGVSLAGWNLLASFIMAVICAAVFAYTRSRAAARRTAAA